VTVLLLPDDSTPSTAFIKFQIQKTNEPGEAREAVLQYLAADYFQTAEHFSDEMLAVFPANSSVAARGAKEEAVLLDFEQYAQRFRLSCAARRLPADAPLREAAFWQARLFNPNLAGDVEVLAFKPDWKKSIADPPPLAAIVANPKRRPIMAKP
jgi:hypothetical protein